MPSRSVRRRHIKRLARFEELTPPQRDAEAARRLIDWHNEARRRARDWGGLLVWDLAGDPRIRATIALLDPSGELQADLGRACAEAVASEAGGCLVQGSRPLADRCRLVRPKSTS